MNKVFCFLASLIVALTATVSWASTKILVDTLYDDSSNMPQSHSPIYVRFSSFELNKAMTKVRLEVDYYITWANDDDSVGPQPTQTMVRGLSYDRANKVIVFESQNKKTNCATVKMVNGIFHSHPKIEMTGLCKVTSQYSDHLDNEFNPKKHTGLDVYFEVNN